ncbi:MAG TPA: NADH-quinone oxidoreductase subunit K [Thermoplasmata archaeon]
MTDPAVAILGAGIAALFAVGFLALVGRRSLVKVLLGIEVLGKAATLTFLLAGYLYDDLGRAQAMVFTVIVIEVIVAALALAMMVNVYRTTGTLSVLAIQRMKG